ncbi:phage tail protein [Stenotrophomonas sp.]|uniref:phage tail protein n=1 Tax=Stenotrophomonas sp. TaxID=69392 RepID=UPI0028AF9D1F|nr:phage tail protein [Stenotrophomonas sp.]
MKKPSDLRAHMLVACPLLQAYPDRLLLFVENGHLVSSNVPGLSYQYQYELTMIVTDFAGTPEAIMVPLLQWVTRHQPELLAHPSTRGQIAFSVEVLASDLVDIELKLQLSERIAVRRDEEGFFQLTYPKEPPTDSGHADTFRGGLVVGPVGTIANLPPLAND